MTRTHVVVRDVRPQDGASLERLWPDLTTAAAAGPGGTGPGEPTVPDLVSQVMAALADDPGSRVLVAEAEGEVVGAAYVRPVRLSPLVADRMLQVTHLHVDPASTRRGVGRALVEAATEHAEWLGLGAVLVASGAQDRELSRFLARLGLAQVTSVRGASVASLRARFRPEAGDPGARHSRTRQVTQVVAARREQRRARLGKVLS